MFNINFKPEAIVLFAGKLKFAEIARAVSQAASQIYKEREALAEDELAREVEPGGAPNDYMSSLHDSVQRNENTENEGRLRDMGLEPALSLKRRCEWISALHDYQMQVARPQLTKVLPNGATIIEDWGYNPRPVRESIEFAIDNMRQPAPSKDRVDAEIELAAEGGNTLTPAEARLKIMAEEKESFDKRRTKIEAVRAEIVDMIDTLVTTAGTRDIMDVFMIELPEKYRLNVAKSALRALDDHIDQLTARKGSRWEGIPAGKKAAGKNWMLYRPAMERLAEVKLLKPDIALLKGWLERNAVEDDEEREFRQPVSQRGPAPTAKGTLEPITDDLAALA